jgi:protoporphyrinogen oxidase
VSDPKHNIAIIGSGPMGLACAYHLLKTGHNVVVYEKADRIGGMSACFDFDGMTIERYYHFICRTDGALFDLLDELELTSKLRWRDTRMGFFHDGVLHKWGDPFHLLMFPKLDLISKLRYGFHIFMTSRIGNWDKLDKRDAISWLKKWVGSKAYDLLWDYLFELKFYEHKSRVSAAWIGTRIKRMARSRKNLFTEHLGYLEGGSDTLLTALAERITAMGGTIRYNAGVDRIIADSGSVQGVVVGNEEHSYDGVVSTVPLPYVPRIAPMLPVETTDKIDAIGNCAVVCAIVKLRTQLTECFWLNVNDPDMDIPGLIEYTNLYPMNHSVVYVPFYVPHSHPKYAADDASILDEVFGYFCRLNPQFSKEWIMAAQVSRYEYAQPICGLNFYDQLPPMQSPIQGFVMADTSYYYPEDRSISESVRIGTTLAKLIVDYTGSLSDRQ